MIVPIARRRFLYASPFVFAAFSRTALADVKWAEKNPPEWSPRDIQKILNDSAWAKEVFLEVAPTAFAGEKGKKDPAADGIRDKRLLAGIKVMVRWESGLPIRLARKTAPPSEAGSPRYTLSIVRLPIPLVAALSAGGQGRRPESQGTTQADVASQMVGVSFLERDGKKPLAASDAVWVHSDFESRIEVSFSEIRQPIELADGAVTFKSQAGPLLVRARFPLEPMVYRGKLEL